ncbi:MAG: hypothetical protein C5B55_07455 [Blastocatellia bacterium]|nr:MAG: hypothetical protein C5B55_07455 [Blastocatellia bacterium]
MSEPRSPLEWQTLYAAAMLESDSRRVPLRIERASEAIHTRLMQLPETSSARSEQVELHSALKYLRRLKAQHNLPLT